MEFLKMKSFLYARVQIYRKIKKINLILCLTIQKKKNMEIVIYIKYIYHNFNIIF